MVLQQMGRRAKFVQSPIHILFPQVGQSQMMMGFRVFRLDGDGMLEPSDGLVKTIVFKQDHAQIVVGFGIVRIERNGPLVRIPCLVTLA